MNIHQGDIYWVHLESQSDISHPYVIIQHDIPNQTLIVCALTTNVKKIAIPGNVLLDVGEANLPKQSIVEVAKTATIKESELQDYVGTLTEKRITQILAGIHLIEWSFLKR